MATKVKPLNYCPPAAAWAEELARDRFTPRWLAHLESCSECRRTLENVAAQPQWWHEVHDTLADRPADLAHITESIMPLSIEPSHCANDPMCSYELAQLQRLLPVGGVGGAAANPAQATNGHVSSIPPCEPIASIGRYELEQLIGRGGMGLVFRAWDTQLHRVVAVKTLSMSLWSIPAARERFIREGRAAAMLSHANIVPMYDVINEPPVPALVMQYIAGPTLAEWIGLHGPMTWQQVMRIGLQLADALCAAHAEGLVHRDIKPGNVLLEADGTRALLSDFGLVRAMDDVTLTQSGLLAGTPHFMSPEQAQGEDTDGRSDLFSLGSLMYFAASGQTPFHGREPMAVLNALCHSKHTSLAELVPEVPLEVSQLIDRLLHKRPEQRPASSHELHEALRRLMGAERRLKPKRVRRAVPRLRLPTVALGLVIFSVWGIAMIAFYSRFTEAELRMKLNGSGSWPARSSTPETGTADPMGAPQPIDQTVSDHRLTRPNELDELARQIEQVEQAIDTYPLSVTMPTHLEEGLMNTLSNIDREINQLQSELKLHATLESPQSKVPGE